MKSQATSSQQQQQQQTKHLNLPVGPESSEPQKRAHLLTGSGAHVKSSLSKLHNLVTARLSPIPPRTAKLLAQQHHNYPRQTQTSSIMKQAHSMGGRNAHGTVSEKMASELAKCYDEIDQIYDYIRGLAPLPVQLRKIKSIDFEQLERDRRIVEHQQHQQVLESKRQQQQQQQMLRPNRQVMRESSGDETSQTLLLAAKHEPTLPQPLRLTTCVADGPLPPVTSSVKRVESLNLGSSHRPLTGVVASTSKGHRSKPAQALLVTPNQRIAANTANNLFRLPRAHSTSTLNKPSGHHHHLLNCRILAAASASRPAQVSVTGALGEQPQARTRTLPALRVSRASIARSSSLKRSTTNRQQMLDGCCEQQKHHLASGKPAEFVDSFADDDDVSSIQSVSRLTSTKSSSTHSDVSSASEDRVKSHSDYENDTASLSGSTTSNSFDKYTNREHKSRRSSARRRTSSGGGTASSANHRLGSHHSSSSGRPGSSSAGENKHPRTITTEHIYEQIPAHKLMLQTNHQQLPGGRVKQYPVMYAPTMGMTNNNSTAVRLATGAPMQKGLKSSTSHQLPLRPSQQARQRPAPSTQQPSATISTTGYQEHLPRLSMTNLNLVSPNLTMYTGTTQRVANIETVRRRASAQPILRLNSRAPPLSPAQLIAQCQMPRAVSKRRLQKPNDAAKVDANNIPGDVWSQKMASNEANTNQTGNIKWLKRDPSRRLTAIGIEQALECMKTAQNGLKDSSMLLNLDQTTQRVQPPLGKLSSTSDKQVPLNNDQQRKHLMDRKQSSRFFNSISDLHSFSSCSSSHSDTGSLRDQSEGGCCNSSGGSTHLQTTQHQRHPRPNSRDLPSDEWNGGGNFVSSRSFIKCYYGNEKENVPAEGDDFLPPVATEQRPLNGSSRDHSLSSSRPKVSAAKATPEQAGEQKVLRKRNGPDRLLGLIGLQTSSARRLAHTKASRPSSDHRQNPTLAVPSMSSARLTEPRASLPGTGSRQTLSANFFQQRPSLVAGSNTPQATAGLVGHFLNSEGPILVRDRRLAALTPNLVHYYQHPCVQVRKMPSVNQQQQHKSTSRRSLNASSSTNSSTNSTSSYKAAIKNSNTNKHSSTDVRLSLADSSQSQEVHVSSSSKHQKQHLLSRPLPNPPVISSSNSSNAGTRSRASSRATPISTNLDLASLTVSKPSPTVTTCTSSGISSRLTGGPTTSGGQRVKSLSELHKQSKRRQQSQQQQQQQHQQTSSSTSQELNESSQLASNSTGGEQQKSARREPDSELSSSLKLFDEKFSSKFADKQLASSSDSLLESINFSGTLNRKPALANAVGSSS